MFPGLTTRLSISTIASNSKIEAKTDIVLVTGTNTISTILPHFGGHEGILILISIDDNLNLSNSGNIFNGSLQGQILTRGVPTILVFVKDFDKVTDIADKWLVCNPVAIS